MELTEDLMCTISPRAKELILESKTIEAFLLDASQAADDDVSQLKQRLASGLSERLGEIVNELSIELRKTKE